MTKLPRSASTLNISDLLQTSRPEASLVGINLFGPPPIDDHICSVVGWSPRIVAAAAVSYQATSAANRSLRVSINFNILLTTYIGYPGYFHKIQNTF